MTKQEIIGEFYNDPKLDKALNKMCPNSLHIEDLKHEVMMILLEKDDYTIINMYQQGYLLFYTVNIIKNQYHSSSSDFYKKFRKEMTDIEVIDDIVTRPSEIDYERLLTERIEEYLLREIHWFDAHIFICYYFTKIDNETGKTLKPLSYRKIQDLHRWHNMKIDYNKVAKIVKSTLDDIKNKLIRDGLITKHNDEWRIDTENLLDRMVHS